MDKYVIDTNIFFNMEAATGLGKSTAELAKMIEKAENNTNSKIELLAPPSIAAEIKTFFKKQDDPLLNKILGFLTITSPSINKVQISAQVLSDIVEDYRQRSFRGMKIAEEELTATAQAFMGRETLVQKEFQIAVGKIISKLRERYRNATRTGTLDSQADFDLIALALEQDACLVTADEGVLNWGRKIGLKEMSPVTFGKTILEYL